MKNSEDFAGWMERMEMAQELIYEAWDAPDTETRVRLAKRALKIYPDCADAYVILATSEARNLEEKIEMFKKGVKAGRRSIERMYDFDSLVGGFWGVLETRPFMRALKGLGICFWEKGDTAAAAEIFWEMLRLNPSDNQGVRCLLVVCLHLLERDEELEELFKRYPDDITPDLLYGKALWAFKRWGDSQESRKALRKALKYNPHVPPYLTGEKRIPRTVPDKVVVGGEDEAADVAHLQKGIWKKTKGAIKWLKEICDTR
ncbi:MAG: hypothetical protein ABIM74_02245 [candidate division WOR-3 bacterium]